MENQGNIFTEYLPTVIASLVAWLITVAAAYLYGKARGALRSQKRWLGKMYPEARLFQREQIIVLPSSMSSQISTKSTPQLVHRLPVSTYHDTEALSAIYGLFIQLGIEANFHFLDTTNRDENIFSVGGPYVNDASKRAFDLVKDKVVFQVSGSKHGIANKVTGSYYQYVDGVTDYGIVLKVTNPANKAYSYTVFAGIGDAGTAGAAFFYTRNLMSIAKKHASKDFFVVVQVSVPHSPRSAELVNQQTLS